MNPLSRDQYRLEKLAGPMGVWDQLQQYQFDILIGLGLKPNHSVLDVGCGPLTVGLKLISYLDSGNYVGIDARCEPLIESYKRIARHSLTTRNPRLIHSSTFGENELEGRRFDYIWVSQLSYHLDESQMTHLFRQAQSRMSESSVLLLDVIDPDSVRGPDATWRGFPYYPRPYDFYEALAEQFSLSLRRRGRIAEYGYPKHINLSTNCLFELRRRAQSAQGRPEDHGGAPIVVGRKRRAPRRASRG